MRYIILLLAVTFWGGDVWAETKPGIRLEGVKSPFPEQLHAFTSQGEELEMSYMDIRPEIDSKGTVVLLHGKNFSGTYFEETAQALLKQGYRVVMPDQIGFGKSTKPQHYQYSFHQLAQNTNSLLKSIGVNSATILGHSMGGMIAVRYALMYPEQTEAVVLLNPIGLEDWKAKGVPYQNVDTWYQAELKQSAERIRAYQLDAYYDGNWKPQYDPWVEQLVSFTKSEEYPLMAWNQALTYDMIFTQPVVYEFPQVKAPVLLIIGQRDTTALGKNLVAPELRKQLGNYPELGRAVAAAFKNSQLVELEGIGHLPHIEDFQGFINPLLGFLDR